MSGAPGSKAPGEASGPPALRLPLHWEWHGRRGPPILLLHGFATNGYTWRGWLPELARRHRVLVVDLKGAGSAQKPDDDAYGPQDQALLLHRLIVHQDLTDLTLVGHSLGGGVALLTALHLLENDSPRLRRLALVAGAAYRQPIPFFIRLAARPFLGPLALRILPSSLVIRAGLRRAYHHPENITSSQVEAYAQPLRNPAGRRALSRMARQIVPPEMEGLSSRYGNVTVPTLLLWGKEDSIVPLQIGKRLAGDLPRAHLAVLSDCGHMPHEEKPRESLEVFLKFLAREGTPTPKSP